MIINNDEEAKGLPKSSIPIHYRELVDDFLRSEEIEKKYFEPLKKKVISKHLQYIPEIRLELRDLDQKLLDLFRKDLEKFLIIFTEKIFDLLTFIPEIKEICDRYGLDKDDIFIIPDRMDVESYIPKIEDLTINFTKFKNQFGLYSGRFMSVGIDKFIRFNWIKYSCSACGKTFEKDYSKNIDKKIKKAEFCIGIKCKNREFEVIDSDSYEVGLFLIEDKDIQATVNIPCYIIKNIDYFIAKIKTINLNEEVDVLGILRINYSELATHRATQRFTYYIEVYDIIPKKVKIIDESIIEIIQNKMKDDFSYFEKLLDAVHPLTYLIDLYFPSKLINALSFTTAGSWNHKNNIRDTLNGIEGGAMSTYKSSIARNFQNAIGKRHFTVKEVNKGLTKAGLIGTTQREQNSIKPIIRYGLLPLYSNGTIVLDEAQKINLLILDVLRCVENGSAGIVQDGINAVAKTLGSIVLTQNFKICPDGSYDSYKSLLENLGWGGGNDQSRLERFDLLYIIPKPDTFTKLRIVDNEEMYSREKLIDEIAKDLELADYDGLIPKIYDTTFRKIEYILFNFFHKANSLYKECVLPEKIKNVIRNLYRSVLQDKEDKFQTDTDVNIRSLNICYKVLKAITCLNLNNYVDERAFQYLRKNCMKLIIPFRDSDLIDTKSIDMNEIFKETISNAKKDELTIKESIEAIKLLIKRRFYNDKSEDEFNAEITNYIGDGERLDENYEFRKLLKNNESWLNKKGFIIESKRGKGNITKIKKKSELDN